ncbi:helix-turn-helix domain-containing protein [Botrimarina hoheduenensis]|uniref:Helix-turn-helix domain protein n=1 Tax=Botrimarina hoheduenensis TaxID=2528000 RepID=A0A5C5VX08_9BACT|nr:helix-turn-helix domain-containing protein [Botrimarina hoheduenensis]TWT42930.1 Helix-turn-helix domain protein [Botrimarina hoheduenensis]
MSQKFIGLDDAAEKLGVSKERLNEIREAGSLRAYRDGASWKFRTEEIDKLIEDGLPEPEPDFGLTDDDMALDVPLDKDTAASDDDLVLGVEPLAEGDDAESILLSGDDLLGGPPRPPSTIIGKSEPDEDDDLTLASESSIDDGRSPGESFAELEELELDLEAASSRILDAADIAAVAKAVEETQQVEPSGISAMDDDDDLELDLGSDLDKNADPAKTGELPSLAGMDMGGSSLTLGDDEDDDFVLGDGSDMSFSSGDSGINLAPSDSGISLDEVPLDLAGSAIGSALDLAALSAVASQRDKELQSGDSLASSDDFLLTPTADADDDEDSSQIVALDDLGSADDDDAVAFDAISDDDDDEIGGFEDVGGDFSAGVEAAPAAVGAASGAGAEFPTWIVVMLGLSLMTMTLCGVLTLDLINTMWSWREPYTVNSAIMDGLLSLIGR